MIRFLYSIFIRLYDFLIYCASFRNEKAQKLRIGRKQTFSILEDKLDTSKHYVWFHAASLGEFEQGRPVMEVLRKERPELGIVLTFFSPSGYEIRKNYLGADVVCYLPSDRRRNVNEFLNMVEPVVAVFIKYEFWPNYLIELSKNKVPVYLISSIFREDQFFFRSYGFFYRNLLKVFTRIFVQDEKSMNLLLENGIKNCEVAGDTRFDRVVEIAKNSIEIEKIEIFSCGGKPVVAGSTWPQDESLLLSADLRQSKLIIVPHEIHEAHLAQIETLTKGKSVRFSKASDTELKESSYLIVDTMGMLSSIYKYARWAYIGGGFGVGIHNTLEAAVYGIPVVFGPNYQQFREAKGLIESGAGFSVSTVEELNSLLPKLDTDLDIGAKAREYTAHNTGATKIIIKELLKY